MAIGRHIINVSNEWGLERYLNSRYGRSLGAHLEERVQNEIPVVDLEDIASGDPGRIEEATTALRTAFGEYGLVYIRNHSIDFHHLESFYDSFLGFTTQPTETKAELSLDNIWYQRGWTPPNTERAVIAGGQPDFKECFFVAPEPLDPLAKAQYPAIYADNYWPKDAPDFDASDFQAKYLTLGHALHAAGIQLLRGCAIALGLDPYVFESIVHGGPHVTRALRYLPLSKAQADADILWGEEHTDFNLLTLLPGGRFFAPNGEKCGRPDDDCGLYLRTRQTPEHPQGRMVRGSTPAGCIVAQVGQQLEILTGGTFQATPHIVRPPKTAGYSRTAVAHFVHAHSHQTLFPMTPFRTPEALSAYSPPVLAGTYSTKTLVDIGLAPPDTMNVFGFHHYERLEQQRS